ncbi:MAG TPA: hypothetical protein VFL31_07485 [Nitrospiraceae bacterium]|nr:hypothetical protein [Nitrospiraceae bacterium]
MTRRVCWTADIAGKGARIIKKTTPKSILAIVFHLPYEVHAG